MRNINQHHPEYSAEREVWERYADLYIGGETLPEECDEVPGSAEAKSRGTSTRNVWQRVFYENYAGSIFDWYRRRCSGGNRMISLEGSDELGRSFLRG